LTENQGLKIMTEIFEGSKLAKKFIGTKNEI
jgi:hypothetical protein